MKRVLSTALALVLTTSIFAVPVSAHEQSAEEVQVERIAINGEIEVQSLMGTVKEINDLSLVVVDAEDNEYIVPIAAFKELEAYQDANVQVGDQIELKGFEASERQGLIGEGKGGMLAFKRGEATNLEDIKERIEVLELEEGKILTLAEKAAGTITVKIRDGVVDIKDLASDEAAELETGERIERLRETRQEEGDELLMTDGDCVVAMTITLDGNLFFANEMTINGVTITLPQQVRPATAIEAKEIE